MELRRTKLCLLGVNKLVCLGLADRALNFLYFNSALALFIDFSIVKYKLSIGIGNISLYLNEIIYIVNRYQQ